MCQNYSSKEVCSVWSFQPCRVVFAARTCVLSSQLLYNPISRVGDTLFNSSSLQSQVLVNALRLNFSRLFTKGFSPISEEQAKRFYFGMYSWTVSGRCHCNGHAQRCSVPGSFRGETVTIIYILFYCLQQRK